jgi:hypothetical protein
VIAAGGDHVDGGTKKPKRASVAEAFLDRVDLALHFAAPMDRRLNVRAQSIKHLRREGSPPLTSTSCFDHRTVESK